MYTSTKYLKMWVQSQILFIIIKLYSGFYSLIISDHFKYLDNLQLIGIEC